MLNSQTINIQNIKPITAIGRTYYLLLPINLDSLELETVIFNLEENLKLGQKIRILIDDDLQLEKVKNLVTKLQNKMEIKTKKEYSQLKDQENFSNLFESKIYKTNFFQLETAKIQEKILQNPKINWQNYAQNGFEYLEVNPNSLDFQIAMNFFLTSFGSHFSRDSNGKLILIPDLKEQKEIEELVKIACQNPANKIFLVKLVNLEMNLENEKNSQNSQSLETNLQAKLETQNQIGSRIGTKNTQFVGAFSFLRIGNEVQLHYTAGKTNLSNDFGGKKLPVLTAAMLDILQNPDYDQTYGQIQKLTFSNKDEIVSGAYEANGFELFENRKCLLLTTK